MDESEKEKLRKLFYILMELNMQCENKCEDSFYTDELRAIYKGAGIAYDLTASYLEKNFDFLWKDEFDREEYESL